MSTTAMILKDATKKKLKVLSEQRVKAYSANSNAERLFETRLRSCLDTTNIEAACKTLFGTTKKRPPSVYPWCTRGAFRSPPDDINSKYQHVEVCISRGPTFASYAPCKPTASTKKALESWKQTHHEVGVVEGKITALHSMDLDTQAAIIDAKRDDADGYDRTMKLIDELLKD
jgi:hypothetical protein